MYIVFDIGGTKTRLAFSEDGREFSNPEIFETPKKFEDGVEKISATIKKISGGKKIKTVAGGIAGTLDKKRERLLRAPHLLGWVDRPLKELLEKKLETQVYIENDTAIVGLGEAVVGAGRGFRIVVYITVSTGVNGARIVDGKLDPSTYGFEIGHQIIDADGTLCLKCPEPKDLENYISGSALEKIYHKKPYEIEDQTVWHEVAKFLAYGLNNTILHWSPDVLVLGGSMMKSPGISIIDVSHHLGNIMSGYPELPIIKKASLGDIGGLYGGLEYIKSLEKS